MIFLNEIEQKTDMLRVRISPKQKEKINKMAEERGMKVSRMILSLLQEESENPKLLDKKK